MSIAEYRYKSQDDYNLDQLAYSLEEGGICTVEELARMGLTSSLLGLSTSHIFGKLKHDRPGLEYWEGGSLAKVHTGLGKGKLIDFEERRGGSKRGMIKEFTPDSRRRLMRTLARLRRGVLPLFLTLTYPREFPVDLGVSKGHLKRFFERLQYYFEDCGAIWKLEFQKRGAPHYHILLWGVGYDVRFLEWVSRAWYEVVGSGDERHLRAGTRVEWIRSVRGTFSYASKYLGKDQVVPEESKEVGVGRFWGIWGREWLPWAEYGYRELTVFQAMGLLDMFTRVAGLNDGNYPALNVYIDVDEWIKNIDWLLDGFDGGF
jgi:hypothetical protein